MNNNVRNSIDIMCNNEIKENMQSTSKDNLFIKYSFLNYIVFDNKI